MRVLMLCPDLLAPPVSGGRIRMYHFARHLAREHTVDIFAPDLPEPESQEATKRLCRTLWLYPASPNETCWARRARQLRSFLTANAYSWRREVMQRLEEVLRSESYDILHLETPYLSRYALPFRNQLPIVIDFFGTTLGAWREFRHARTPGHRLRTGLGYLVALASERRCARAFGTLIAVSRQDRDYLQSLAPHSQIHVVPNGVDCATVRPGPFNDGSRPVVVFTGDMGFAPSGEAALLLASRIFPEVHRSHPDAELRLVGRNPDLRLLALRGPSVRVTGEVADIVAHLHAATVYVAPHFTGSGPRTKLLEAMGAGLPIVTTTIGIEGIDATHSCEVLIADDPAATVGAVLDLLKNPARRRRLGAAARRMAEERYDWSRCLAPLEILYSGLLPEKAARC